ncbi:MAG: RNA polymerase factor sigma-32 [Syntrophorhabdales bacterium]
MPQERITQWKKGTREEGGAIPFDPLKKYLSEISRHSVLSREEEMLVAERAHLCNDREASERLVTSNLRLVVKIALEYYGSYVNILDLIQEGNIGLVRAVKKYNPYRGTRFSTYASLWIRAYILKYIMDSWSLVKLGKTQGQRRLFYSLKKEKKKLEDVGVFATPQLLAQILDVKVAEVEDMEKRLAYADISLDAPLHEGGEETFVDALRSDENVEEIVVDKEKREILNEKISAFRKMLDQRESFIFEQRVMAEEPYTLDRISKHFGISRERVRQVESKMLKKFTDKFELEFKVLGLSDNGLP